MVENIDLIFGIKSKIIIELIQKYKRFNPDLKEYPKQQFNIKNPNFFKVINTVEKAYWFGFICADALVKQKQKSYNYNIRFELSSHDRERLVELAGLIGYDIERIKDIRRIGYDHNGKLKTRKNL